MRLVLISVALLLSAVTTTVTVQAQVYQLPRQVGLLGGPPSGKEIELGRKLFGDPRLSVDNTISCASCHKAELGFTDGLPVSIGVGGQRGTRNAPTVINACYSPRQFLEGRTIGQTTQALLPLVNPIEMANQSEQAVINKLERIAGYVSMFADTFGVDVSTGKVITAPRLARAIAAYESTLISFDAPIDRYLAGDDEALTPDAKVGFEFFKKANCMACHVPPLYTDYLLHNNGMEFASKTTITDNGKAADLAKRGKQVTSRDIRAFKTPTLRNLKYTAPYNHSGNFTTIRRCVIHYNAGGANNKGYRDRYIDQRIKSQGWSEINVDYIVKFLEEGLTGLDYPMIETSRLP